MAIPLFDLKRAYSHYGLEIEEAVLRVLRSTQYLNGPETKALETELTQFLGVPQAVAVASGTEALYLILKALNLPVGSIVFVPSLTFVATAEVVLRAGLTPFFVDVEDDYPNLSLESLKEAYKLSLRKKFNPACVLAVSLYGLPARLIDLQDFCRQKNLILIEDICQSLGARLSGQMVGSFGICAGASFYPTKTLAAAGDAGMIFTKEEGLALKIRAMREHGQTKPYYYEYHGVNGRMDEIQAAILRVKLKYFEKELNLRMNIANLYTERLSKLYPQVKLFKSLPDSYPAYSLFTVRVERREELQDYLRRLGISSNVYYRLPLHKQPIFMNHLPLSIDLPNTEKLSREVLSLPFHPYLTAEEVVEVCQVIESFFRR